MLALERRISLAEQLWQQGQAAEQGNDLAQAYLLFTEAHDLITDCSRLHAHAHRQLRRVNLKLGNYRELAGDWLLHILTPLGIFELVAYFSRTDAFAAEICKRKPS